MNRSFCAFPSLSLAAARLMSAGTTFAQPVLVINGLGDDLAASGNKTTGLVFDAAAAEYVTYIWERGVGYTRVNG
ncbi:MAG: hypothetical protein ACOYN0_15885, partial [Phycisphaerales bacterium]